MWSRLPPAAPSASGFSTPGEEKVGAAEWAMSLRNAVSMKRAVAGTGTGWTRLPGTNPAVVTNWGIPLVSGSVVTAGRKRP